MNHTSVPTHSRYDSFNTTLVSRVISVRYEEIRPYGRVELENAFGFIGKQMCFLVVPLFTTIMMTIITTKLAENRFQTVLADLRRQWVKSL